MFKCPANVEEELEVDRFPLSLMSGSGEPLSIPCLRTTIMFSESVI